MDVKQNNCGREIAEIKEARHENILRVNSKS